MIIPKRNRSKLREAYDDETPGGAVIRASGGRVQKVGEDGERPTIDIVVSTPNEDRHGDTIDQSGWDLEAYRNNPVVPWNHRYGPPPVATAETTEVIEVRLMQRWVFAPRDLDPFGHAIGRMYQERLLHAASVGFDPIEWTYDEERDGFDFVAQELVESSSVTIPSNRESVAAAREAGVDTSPIARRFSRIMDENPEQTDQFEKAWSEASTDKTYSFPSDSTKDGQVLNTENKKRCCAILGAAGDMCVAAGEDPHERLDEHMTLAGGDTDKSAPPVEARQFDEAVDVVESLQALVDQAAATIEDAETLVDELEDGDATDIVDNLIEWASGVQTDGESWVGSIEAVAASLEDEESGDDDGDDGDNENSGEPDKNFSAEQTGSVAESNTHSYAEGDDSTKTIDKADDEPAGDQAVIRLME